MTDSTAIAHRAVLDCERLDAGDRFDAWTSAVNSTFVPLVADQSDREERSRFTGRLVSQSLGTSAVSSVAGDAVRVRRTPSLIAQTDPGYLKVGLQLSGVSVITQDGRDTALAPGDFAIYDTSRPYALDFDAAYKMFVLMFPVEAVRLDRESIGTITASRFSGRSGLGAITSRLLTAISEQLDEGELTGAVSLSDAVFDLLGATLAERLPDVVDEQAQHRAFVARVEAFIDAHLADPHLTVQAIADAHHVSIRYLQKEFAGRGETVSALVRRRRLEQSRRDLANVRLGDGHIAMVGARWGFIDATAFARAFRQQFGVTPSQYRAETKAAALGD